MHVIFASGIWPARLNTLSHLRLQSVFQIDLVPISHHKLAPLRANGHTYNHKYSLIYVGPATAQRKAPFAK